MTSKTHLSFLILVSECTMDSHCMGGEFCNRVGRCGKIKWLKINSHRSCFVQTISYNQPLAKKIFKYFRMQ